jgi:hypothetical protein
MQLSFLDILPAHFMAFQNIRLVEIEYQLVYLYYRSQANKKATGCHGEIGDPVGKAERCGGSLIHKVAFPDHLQAIPADYQAENQDQKLVDNRQKASGGDGKMFNQKRGRHMPVFCGQVAGSNEDSPDDQIYAYFFVPVRWRRKDIPHDNAVKGATQGGQSQYAE